MGGLGCAWARGWVSGVGGQGEGGCGWVAVEAEGGGGDVGRAGPFQVYDAVRGIARRG